MKWKFFLTIVLYSFSICSHAQMGKFFNPDNQLSSSFVTQVYLDHDGFIWATTRDGINRYDGYQFRVFRRENEADKELASNYVNTMMQDRNGLFYFGMYGALQTWDGSTFNHVTMTDLKGKPGSCYATCFLERKNGDVLAGTSGLGVMKFSDKTHASQLGGALADLHTINAMIEDRKGRLWMINDGKGLICYDGQKVQRYLEEQGDLSFSCLCEDQAGVVYVGTTDAGVFKQQGDGFVHLEGTQSKPVSALYCDHYGSIIIGYDGQGLAIYEPRNDRVLDNSFYSMEVDLKKSKVYSITEDNSGNLWLGLLQKGIYKQPIVFKGFSYMGYKQGERNQLGSACIISTHIDRQRRAWIGTDKDGLYCLDSEHRVIKHYTEGIPATVMALEEDLQGHIWIGSYGEGLAWIDPVSQKPHRVDFAEDKHLIVMDIECDSLGRLWMATHKYGLLCMDQQGNLIKKYVMQEGADTDRQMNCITNNYVSQVSISPDGKRVYAATSMGLCCLDIERDSWISTFGQNCPNYGQPVRIAREYDGYIWAGTNEGLYCYDLKGKVLKQYDRKDGLADNGVSAIERYTNGMLWIGTNHGLSCLNPRTGLFQNYFADDGLQGNEFSDGASYVTQNGTLIFGGTGGVTWFRPEEITQSKWEAVVRLTNFIVNGQTVEGTDRFHLSYHDNSFAVQFSTLTYENPEHISYLYSINGEQFIRMLPGSNEIVFSHLPPGTYRFRVKAERNNIETPEYTFTVVVASPWYRSSWAYFIYTLLFGALLWQFVLGRRRREQTRRRMQEHIHAEELGEAKLRFFMNISHEIRTPMTLIVTPLLSLIKNETDPHRRGVYETIRRNAERILSLINQMMDLRKIDKGQMLMRMTETNLVAFIDDIHTLFKHQAASKQITLTFEHDTDCLDVWVDRKQFDKVIVNILSNAFKFTPTGGEIDIRLTHDDQQAHIFISDNGEQIPEEKLDKIFERFYQSSSTVNDRNVGTGIGLDLTRSLVELHHGTIEARNLKQGCEFVVNIPLGKAHLSPDELVLEQETATAVPETTEMDSLMEELEGEVIEQPISNGKARLVIVEDDDEIRNYLLGELSEQYQVATCTNGKEALSEVLRSGADLVISDVMMPEMDGNQLCAKLKMNPNTNVIPVILLTAKNRDEDKLEGLETGADAYIVKPFNMDILRRTIVNLLNSHRLLRLKYERNDVLEEQVDEVKIKTPDEKLLDRVMTTINTHLEDSDLSVDMIADEVGISRVHLHRKMKELTGQTPHDFIRNIRLKRAAYLLSGQGVNVTEVMYACGFSNSASFSTVFKKFYGVSPREYMKEHGNR